jgi:hypothetical protein
MVSGLGRAWEALSSSDIHECDLADGLVDHAKSEDARHWVAHRRPISTDNLRTTFRISTARCRMLVAVIRASHAERRSPDPSSTGDGLNVFIPDWVLRTS